MTIHTTFDTLTWDEEPISSTPTSLSVKEHAPSDFQLSMKLTRVRTERIFRGGLVGVGIAEYIFSYHSDGTVKYNGVMHFCGHFEEEEKIGEFVAVTDGWYEKSARATWDIDERSGKGAFEGIKGKGGYDSKEKKDSPAWLEIS